MSKKIKKKNTDYVCPVCFRRANNCICQFYSLSLILIDEKLQYAIQTLNDKGHKTIDCCEGHFEDKIPNTYISFRDRLIDCPKGFKIERNNIIRHVYKKTTKEQFKEEQKEMIENINKWVNGME